MRYPTTLAFTPLTMALDDIYPAYTDKISIGIAIEWLEPMRAVVAELKSGEVDTINGYPITRVSITDTDERIDYCINGFVDIVRRILPAMDTGPMERISKRLASGVMLELSDLEAWEAMNMEIAARMTGLSKAAVNNAAVTEQILVGLQRLGLA